MTSIPGASLRYSSLLVHRDDVLQDDGMYFLRLEDEPGVSSRVRSVALMRRQMISIGLGPLDRREVHGVAPICRIARHVDAERLVWSIQLADGPTALPVEGDRMMLIAVVWANRVSFAASTGIELS